MTYDTNRHIQLDQNVAAQQAAIDGAIPSCGTTLPFGALHIHPEPVGRDSQETATSDVPVSPRRSGGKADKLAVGLNRNAGVNGSGEKCVDRSDGDFEHRLRETLLTERSNSRTPSDLSNPSRVHQTAEAARRALDAWFGRALAILRSRSAWGEADRPTILIKATAGIGKTRTICQEIASGKNLPGGRYATVWFAVPNHDMAAQLVKAFKEIPNFPMERVLVLEGRDRQDMCRRSALIARVGDVEGAIQGTFCAQGSKRCPYFQDCKYQALRREACAAKGRIIVMPHAALVQHPELPDPDLVVIDESIWSVSIAKSDFSLETFDRVAKSIVTAPDLKERTRQRVARQLLDIRSALTDSKGLMLKVLRERKLETPTKLHQLASAVAGTEASPSMVSPDLTDREIEQLLSERLAPARRRVAAAIRQFAAEIERQRDASIGVTFDPNENIELAGRTCREQQARIRVFGRRPFRIPVKAPILLLDASADPMIDSVLWGKSIKYVHVNARRNVVATQSTSRSGSRRSLVPADWQSPKTAADIARLQKRIAGLVPGDGSGVAVFGSLPVITAIEPFLPDAVMTGHFNALRGINKYEGCHTAIIIGREQPSCRDLEDLARSMFFGDDAPIRTAIELEERKVRLWGCNMEMTSDFHPDPRVQAILAQIREREIEQAMDRLRFINDDPTPKTVILVSRVATEVDISFAMRFDHLCDGGAPFTRAIGVEAVVRLAEKEILGDIDPAWQGRWETGAAIRMQYTRAAKACGHKGKARDILAKYCPGHRMFEYQLRTNDKANSGPRQRALIRRDVGDPRQALQDRYPADVTVMNLVACDGRDLARRNRVT